MTEIREFHNANAAPFTERGTHAKLRACLMCSRSFKSDWSGERVCKLCKSHARWRHGGSSLAL